MPARLGVAVTVEVPARTSTRYTVARDTSNSSAGSTVLDSPALCSLNKWAAGISDIFALGILNEALGLGLPIVVAPYAKAALASHPAFDRGLEVLRDCGVILTPTEAIRPHQEDTAFRWVTVIDALPR